jgi:predicted enzyme related to lactoylglutathione lyase
MEIRHVSAVLFARDFRRLAGFYSEVVGLALSTQRDDHAVLNRLGFDLVVHQIPARLLADTTTAPPRRREEAAIKLSFPVDDLERVRRTTATLGGVFDPPEREWTDGNERTCMGQDPEGNVFQVTAPV